MSQTQIHKEYYRRKIDERGEIMAEERQEIKKLLEEIKQERKGTNNKDLINDLKEAIEHAEKRFEAARSTRNSLQPL